MGWSLDLGVLKVEDVDDVLRARTAELRGKWARDEAHPGEAANVARVASLVKGGLEAVGGRAHVWIGASHRVEPDGSEQTSISATVTVTTPRK